MNFRARGTRLVEGVLPVTIDRSLAKLYQFSAILRRVIVRGSINVLLAARARRDVGRSDDIARGSGKFRVTLIDLSHFRNCRWTARLILVITHDIPVPDYLHPANIAHLLSRGGMKFLSVFTGEHLSLPACRGIESEK